MADGQSNLRAAGIFANADQVDISDAQIETNLSRVWADDATGEVAVSIERVLFDNPVDIAARYLDPHGFSLNLENLLATVDSMRFCVFATSSNRPGPDGRLIAKKLMPGVYMHLPRVRSVGPLLTRFYDEVGRYEREVARLQDLESKAKKAVAASIKDQSGRGVIDALQQENASLRDELAKVSKRLADADKIIQSQAPQAVDSLFSGGLKPCVVRGVRLTEGVALIKSGEQQFNCALRKMNGLPSLNARGMAYFEGGVLKSVFVFDPEPKTFDIVIVEVMAVEDRKLKVRYADRREAVVTIPLDQALPYRGSKVILYQANGHVIDFQPASYGENSALVDAVYDEQTKNQIGLTGSGGADD